MRIYIDRLKEGHEETFEERVAASEIFDAEEVGSVIEKPIEISFKAYLAGQELVIEWQEVKAECFVACTICNERFALPILIENARHIEPLENIRGAVFNPSSLIREQILLEVPAYAECTGGACPQREIVEKYIGKDNYGSTT